MQFFKTGLLLSTAVVSMLAIGCSDTNNSVGPQALEPAAKVIKQSGIMLAGSPPNLVPVAGSTVDLKRHDNKLTAVIKTSGMGANHHFTLWAVLFNYDGSGNLNTRAAVIAGGGTSNANGEATVSAKVDAGPIGAADGTYIEFNVTNGGDSVFDNVEGVRVIFAIRDHGPTQPGLVDDQKKTHGGGCNNDPEDLIGQPGNFPCSVVQRSNPLSN